MLGEWAQIINSRGERAGAQNVDCTVLAYKHFMALIKAACFCADVPKLFYRCKY